MDFYSFCQLIHKHQVASTLPHSYEYPNELKLTSPIWKSLKNLHKFTQKNGYEHSASIFSVDKEIVVTSPNKGTKTSVLSRNQISLKYEPKETKVGLYFEKQIYVDGRLVKKNLVKKSELPKKPAINYIFTVHSHPPQEQGSSFFSRQDIKSLLSSKGHCTGLITEKLLIACKHQKSPQRLSTEQERVVQNINSNLVKSENLDLKNLSELKLIFYIGDFKKSLVRIGK